MPNRILVDAIHPEEVRVVKLIDGRVQEFDSETSIKPQVKGNIYLAKVTRVEPSLQAAFVEYGGNKHGFLPFSEIHPDYYQIPVQDKQKLLASLREAHNPTHENDVAVESTLPEDDEEMDSDIDDAVESEDTDVSDKKGKGKGKGKATKAAKSNNIDSKSERSDKAASKGKSRRKSSKDSNKRTQNKEDFEAEEEDFEVTAQRQKEAESKMLYKKYNIQEVIKRGQIILVQIEKEERGNKGASLTTYISLAGRYCVLMPNSHRRGGVSRRIESYEDRKRLRDIVRGITLPIEASVIVRTAGSGKSKDQIEGDYDYLVKLWNTLRERTLCSEAPSLIHMEGDIIGRSVRDLFDDDVDEILIEGESAYDIAKQLIKKVAKDQQSKVKQYKNKVPIFNRYKIEEQIEEFYQAVAPLESGGYLVINPTEALISIDVNSGKSTSTRNVEETALATNLEAANEVSRQLRLRDLSGLIVIDFIDMLDYRNRRVVERELRAACIKDRARVQVGRISPFGLLEMSRQRLRPSFYEVNTIICTHCNGMGVIKGTETQAVSVLRKVEREISYGTTRYPAVEVFVAPEVANYLFNFKRAQLEYIESHYDIQIFFQYDGTITDNDCIVKKLRNVQGSALAPLFNKNADKDFGEEPANSKDRSSKSRDKSDKNKEQKRSSESKFANANDSVGAFDHMLKGLWKKIID